jgi:hypothetical protein
MQLPLSRVGGVPLYRPNGIFPGVREIRSPSAAGPARPTPLAAEPESLRRPRSNMEVAHHLMFVDAATRSCFQLHLWLTRQPPTNGTHLNPGIFNGDEGRRTRLPQTLCCNYLPGVFVHQVACVQVQFNLAIGGSPQRFGFQRGAGNRAGFRWPGAPNAGTIDSRFRGPFSV